MEIILRSVLFLVWIQYNYNLHACIFVRYCAFAYMKWCHWQYINFDSKFNFFSAMIVMPQSKGITQLMLFEYLFRINVNSQNFLYFFLFISTDFNKWIAGIVVSIFTSKMRFVWYATMQLCSIPVWCNTDLCITWQNLLRIRVSVSSVRSQNNRNKIFVKWITLFCIQCVTFYFCIEMHCLNVKMVSISLKLKFFFPFLVSFEYFRHAIRLLLDKWGIENTNDLVVDETVDEFESTRFNDVPYHSNQRPQQPTYFTESPNAIPTDGYHHNFDGGYKYPNPNDHTVPSQPYPPPTSQFPPYPPTSQLPPTQHANVPNNNNGYLPRNAYTVNHNNRNLNPHNGVESYWPPSLPAAPGVSSFSYSINQR